VGSNVNLAPGQVATALVEVAHVGGIVATYCDHTEHNEPAGADTLRAAAGRLRSVAEFLADELRLDLQEAYANRLAQLERRSLLGPLLPSPADDVRRARSLRDLQLAQLRHDRHYHPDVFGLTKRDQLIHVAIHLSKLTAAVATLTEGDSRSWLEFSQRRLPDLLLFGVKLSTLAGEILPSESTISRRRL
jgi:hypothetical protein